MLKIVFFVALCVALAASQAFFPVFPTAAELAGIPQIYTAGYVENCLAAGLAGGCSACVHGSHKACDWVSVTESGLEPGESSSFPFGGIHGLCMPKGIHAYRSFVLTYYQRFMDEQFISGSVHFDPNSVIEVNSHRCPVNPAKEPMHKGYGISANDALAFSTYFEEEFCDFPSQDGSWIVDRSSTLGLGLFGIAKRATSTIPSYVSFTSLYCNLFNTADHSINNAIVMVSPNGNAEADGPFITTAFDLKDWLDGNTFTGSALINPRNSYEYTITQLRECLALDQAAGCTTMCPEYGKNLGMLPCPDAIERLYTTCAPILRSFSSPVKREVDPKDYGFNGLGLLLFAETSLGGAIDLNAYREEYEDAIAEWRTIGFEPKCYDPFRIRASKRWLGKSGLADPCKHLGKPYVDTCDDECRITYFDPRNCGACGKVCPQGQVCEKGKCQINEP